MPNFDDLLSRELERAARPAAPDARQVYDQVRRRRARRGVVRRVQAGALTVAVLAATAGGFLALDRAFQGEDGGVRPGGRAPFTLGETPETIVTIPGVGHACRVSAVRGRFPLGGWTQITPEDPPPLGTAYLYQEVSDATCPGGSEDFMLAIDADADGQADGPAGVRVELNCRSRWGCDLLAAPSFHGGFSWLLLRVTPGRASLLQPPVPGAGGSSLAIFTDPSGTTPAVLSWDAQGDVRHGLRCVGSASLMEWQAVTPDGGSTWTLTEEPSEIDFVSAQILPFGNSDTAQVGADELPSLTKICGAPVAAAPWGQAIPDSNPETGRDIGLEFRLCDPHWLGGIDFLGDGTAGSAWTGMPARESGICRGGRTIVAVDHTGDRLADSWVEVPDGCEQGCIPHDATDLDGDGSEELIVGNLFSIVDYNVFTIRPNSTGDLAVEPILVAAPGHVPAGLIAGRELEISAGGDEGFASWISCEGYPANPVIVWTWIWGPVETNIPKEVHITRIQLKADGLIHVIGTNDYMLPAGQPSGLSPATAPACGVDWQLWD